MNKQSLRKLYLQKRSELTPSEYEELNLRLCVNFFAQIDLSNVNVLHTFLPIKKFKEPDTWLIINRIKKEFPAIRLSVPKVSGQANDLEHFYIEDMQELPINDWGIPEPDFGATTLLAHIDMVLVPLLAFDIVGNRVGYGKGFYDKFLSTCSPECKKIGLSFFPPVESIDVNEHDQPLDIVITPDRIFIF